MATYYYTYIAFLVFGIAISIYLLARLWAIRKTAGAYNLIWSVVCAAVWSFTYIFEIATQSSTAKTAWLKAEYLAIPYICPAIFTFTLVYSGRGKWLTRGRFIFLSIIPTISLLLAITNEWHHLLWSTIKMPATPIGPITVGHGPWYNINVVYSYALMLLATFFLAQMAVHRHTLYRSQAIVMLVGMVIPWIGNLIYVLHPGLDWTPLAFTLAVIAFVICLARFGLMDILPVAQSVAFNAMRDGIIVADARGRIVEINPSAQNILLQKSEQVIGKSIQQLLPAWVKWNTETATAFEVSEEIAFGEGPKKRTYNVRIAPILDRHGQISAHMATLTDITDQKLAQAQMLLQVTALEAAVTGIVITDKHGNIEWVNPAFTSLTGYSREEVLGKNLRFLKSGKQPPEYYQNLWQTILSGKVWRGELINRCKDASEYYEEEGITPLVQPDGTITNFIAIKQDITKRRLAEEQLRQAHEVAVEANHMKTQLLASVSHDLRTPLGAIMGYAEILQTGVLGSVNNEQQNAAAEILDSANRLVVFVNNLIGQAQLETGRVVIRQRAFQPDELIDGVKSVVGFMAKKKGLAFETEIDPALPEQLKGDPYWLKQVLHNLVNNAVKFTEKGKVQVRLCLADNNHWAMQVCDTGIGVPEDARQTIFEAFRQVEGKESLHGSGLGLSIVNQLTTLMNGKIELQSELGRGSTFTVILPLILP